MQKVVMKFFKLIAGDKNRVLVSFYLIVWAIIICMSWIYWNELHWGVKTVIVILEVLSVPDIDIIRSVYKKR